MKTCKNLKCSLNEATLSILGQAIKAYAVKQNEKLDQITITSTFALKDFPKNYNEITMGNGYVPLYYQIPVSDDIKANISQNR